MKSIVTDDPDFILQQQKKEELKLAFESFKRQVYEDFSMLV